jgi:hypothetical protein
MVYHALTQQVFVYYTTTGCWHNGPDEILIRMLKKKGNKNDRMQSYLFPAQMPEDRTSLRLSVPCYLRTQPAL